MAARPDRAPVRDLDRPRRHSPDDPLLGADLESIFHTSHEFGHGIYEYGLDRELDRTPLTELNSMVLHESQSRLWENLVCRSRPFWRCFFPKLPGLFPAELSDVDVEAWWRSVNKVEPSYIRVEADEVTYGLHTSCGTFEQEIIGSGSRSRICLRPGTRR